MNFESGEEREEAEEGEGAGRNFSEVEKATSEKSRSQLLRSCIFFEKNYGFPRKGENANF